MWVVPTLVFTHRFPITSFYGELTAAVLGLAALFLLARRDLWEGMAFPRIALVPLGLVLLLMLQLFLTDRVAYPAQSFLAALYLLWALFLMVLAGVLCREIGRDSMAAILAWFVLAGGVLNAGLAILQHYRIHTFLDPVVAQAGAQVAANMAQYNFFADYIGLAIASLLFLSAGRRRILWSLLPLLLFVLALTSSRSAWLYLGALAILSAGHYWRDRSPAHKTLALVALALLPGFALMQWAAHLPWLAGDAGVVTASDRLFAEVGDGGSIRLAIWREALQIFLQFPWLGAGQGQFSWQHFQMVMPSFPGIGAMLSNAHNLIMQLLAEQGLFAAVLVAGGVAMWLVSQFGRRFSLTDWWLLALLAIIGIHSMLEYPLWNFKFLGIAAILLGMGETRVLRLDLRATGRLAFVLMLALGWVSAINLAASYRSLEGLLYKSYHYAPRDEAEAQALLQGLQDIHQESLLTPYIELAYAGAIEVNREHLADKLELNGRVMRFAPASPVVYRQALLLALNGEQAAAVSLWRRAAIAYPGELEKNRVHLQLLAQADPKGFGGLLAGVGTR